LESDDSDAVRHRPRLNRGRRLATDEERRQTLTPALRDTSPLLARRT
jgi:hypothetical protein